MIKINFLAKYVDIIGSRWRESVKRKRECRARDRIHREFRKLRSTAISSLALLVYGRS